MGDTVVFTVPLDPDDDVQIQTRHDGPSLRDDFVAQWSAVWSSVRWRLWFAAVAVITLSIPVAFAVLQVEPWFGPTVTAVAALLIAGTAGALGASLRHDLPPDSPWTSRVGIVAARLAALIAAASLVIAAAAPALLWVTVREGLSESQSIQFFVAFASLAFVSVSLGAAVSSLRQWRRPRVAGVLAALALAILPLVTTVDEVPQNTFTTSVDIQDGRAMPTYYCRVEMVTEERVHTERTAWMLVTSPLVVVVDAPFNSPSQLADAPPGSLVLVQAGLRSARLGPDPTSGHCFQATSLGPPPALKEQRYAQLEPVGMALPWGLGAAFFITALLLGSRHRPAALSPNE
jgi:hypothetical protein